MARISGYAVVAANIGALALVMGFLPVLNLFVAVPLGAIAIMCGARGRHADIAGRGLGNTINCWLGIILGVLAMLVTAAIMIVFAS